MIAVEHERFEIARPLDLQLAVLRCQRSMLLRGASDLERSVVATIVSELGSNVLKYADRGTLELRRLRDAGAAGVEITARDAGPGIADVALALTDHYSSGRTLGLGLPGVRRMADELDIGTTPGGGTTVTVRKRWSGRPAARSAAERVEDATLRLHAAGPTWQAAATVRARDGHRAGGDHVAIVERDERLVLAIVDATGHGSAANAVALDLTHRLREHVAYAPDPDDVAGLLHLLHEASVGTVGAAVGLALLDARRDELRYLAVGNVRAAVSGRQRFTGVSRDGILGRRWPTPFVQRAPLHAGDLVLLWTDGLPSTLPEALAARGARAGTTLADRDAAAIADALVTEHGKHHDDAACLVVRWRQ
ncbi:MAG: SpoIIE family protein phosphatase [Trueperaceae bacterium]|nr:SpoIIE family protein phosphatase [Trueperaceae bacterium]